MVERGARVNQQAEIYRSPDEPKAWLSGFLQRHWKLMAGVALVILGLVAIYLVTVRPVYVANSIVAMDPRRNTLNEMGGAVVSAAPLTDDLIETESVAIRSRGIASAVVAELKLGEREDFGAQQAGFLRRWVSRLVYGRPISPESADRQRQSVDEVLRNLDASRIGSSYAIRIGYSSSVPAFAAEVANAVASNYVAEQKKQNALERATAHDELEASLKSLRTRLATAERQLADARARAGIIDARSTSTSDIALLQNQRASAHAEAVLAAGRASPASIDAAVNASPVILSLRGQIGKIRADREIARTRYGPDHPDIANSLATEAALNDQIAQETAALRRIVAEGLQAEAAAQANRAASQAGSLARARSELAGQIAQTGTIASLETEVQSLRTLHDAELNRFKQVTGVLEDRPSARLVSLAVTPQVPARPNLPLTVGLGVLLALVGALAVAILAELTSGVLPGRGERT